MNKRSIGIDIIKVIAIIFVPSLHFFMNYGFYNEPYIGYGKIIQEMIRWLQFSCIGLFVMSTGYLQCNKNPTKKYFLKIMKYIVVYFIYCIISALIVYGKSDFFKNFMKFFLQYPAYFWYMSFFIGFYLILPYLNIIIKNIKDKKEFRNFILVLLMVISIPEFVNFMPPIWGDWKYIYLPNWWREFFSVVYYMLGAYYRNFKPKMSKKNIILILITIIGAISMFDYNYSVGGKPNVFGGGYGSIITVIISCCVFSLFYDLDIDNKLINNVLRYISELTLEIYLGLVISDKLVLKIINKYLYAFTGKYNFKLYFIEFPLNFLISLMIAIIIKNIMNIFSKVKFAFNKHTI